MHVQNGDTLTDTTARWVVDASGRNRLLGRQLDLKRANAHQCNAVWLRVATEIDVGRWSDDPEFQGRLVEGDRAMSTNHLMGQGYWVWLIRLASGATSVGIVADPPFTISTGSTPSTRPVAGCVSTNHSVPQCWPTTST